MFLWAVHFQTAKPIPVLPRLCVVSSETIVSPAYEHHGKFRTAEPHCIYKYTLKGRGVFSDAGGEHRVAEGSGFLCEIADARTGYCYPKDGTEPWTFVWIAFDGDAARHMVREIVGRHGAIFALPRDNPELQRVMEFRKDDGRIRTVTPAWGARVVTDLLLALAASKEEQREEQPEHVLIRRAQEAVAEHLERRINATELAGILNVSREYLTRRFKEETAMTPHAYILREKLRLACHLLKETSMSSKQIAARLGYDEPAHFTRTFKRVIHMTPSRFRAVGTIPVV
jgi:AraC-like DNA-binding protein